jgi:hypothetical protein
MRRTIFVSLLSLSLSGCSGVQWQDVLIAGLKFGRCAADAVVSAVPPNRADGGALPENPYTDAGTPAAN